MTLADLAPRIQKLRQTLDQLNMTRMELESRLSDRKVELADKETVRKCVEELKCMLQESSLTERKSFIKSFVKEVKVTGDEVCLSYCPPLLAGMMKEEMISV